MLIGIRQCGWFVALLGVLCIALFALLPSNSASAASDYDNTIEVTTEPVPLTCSGGYGGPFFDATFYNIGQALGTLSQTDTEAQTLLDIIDGSEQGWYVISSQGYEDNTYSFEQSIVITYGTEASKDFLFRTNNNRTYFSTSQLNLNQIQLNPDATSSGGWQCINDRLIATNSLIADNPSNYIDVASENNGFHSTKLVATKNIDVVYPVGYEGVLIETITPGYEDKENLYPHYTYLVTDKEIKAYNDVSQELPDLPEPDEGWQNNEWQVMWYLFKCGTIDDDNYLDCDDREMINSELLSRDEEYTWEVDEYGDYLLIAEFRYQSCYRYASWPATPDNCVLNSEHDDYSFVPGRTVYLPIDGMNIVGDTGNLDCDAAGYCYDDTRFKDCNVVVAIATLSFDDFNYADCLENISLLANLLSFDTIKFNNSWVSSGNCYTLGTLGNWLNLDNKLVCPYFSNEVRNTVTPFITFMLGLIMIRFIAGRGSHGSMREDI